MECAKNLGICISTLARWKAQLEDNDCDISVRESGNYETDKAQETSYLKRKLRDALDV